MFVKADGSRTIMMEMALSDKVSKGFRPARVAAKAMCTWTCEERVLRRGEALRRCGVSEGSVVQVVSRI